MQTHTKSLLLVGLLLAFPAALSCQVGREVPREARASQEVREQCQPTAAHLLAGPSAHEVDELVGGLMYCEVSGPPALAAAWRNPLMRSNALSRLVTASQKNQDRRIMEALLPVVQDEREDFDFRLAAVSVLASYLMPDVQADPAGWYSSPDQEWPNVTGGMTHATWAVGAEPPDTESRGRIVNALNRMADGSQEVRLKLVIEQILRRWE